MEINFKPHYSIQLSDCKNETIISLFTQILPLLLGELYKTILGSFAEYYMSLDEKPFQCSCGNNKNFIWKTRAGRKTKITTTWTDVFIPQQQIQCKSCQKKISITRVLLNLRARQKLSDSITKKMALVGALSTFRCGAKIAEIFGSSISKSTIWRSVQETGSEIEFGLDTDGVAAGMADGTGIPIQGIQKRGRELKVFAQYTESGALRIASLAIGKYESDWNLAFEGLKEELEKMKRFHLIVDGDKAIIKGIDAEIELTIQRCLWHIAHQLKYYLWKDGVKHKSKLWLKVICQSILLTSLPENMPEDDEVIRGIVEQKDVDFKALIKLLSDENCRHCQTHLENAEDEMFTSLSKKLRGKTTSLIERIMRTVNLRINVGKWKEDSALNLLKVRLAYYYNGFDVVQEKREDISFKKVA